MNYIEKDFPIEKLNEIAMKESTGAGKKPIYGIHKWWARRIGSIFRMLILTTFSENDVLEEKLWQKFYSKNQLKTIENKPPLILDPFMGGGTTIVEALRLGCKVIGIDLNPVAWFVTKKEIDPIDFNIFAQVFRHLEKTVAPKIKYYYQTRCPKGHSADVMYVFGVKSVPCTNCKKEVKLFSSFKLQAKNDYYTLFCPQCYNIINPDLLNPKVQKLIKIDLEKEIICPECSMKFIPNNGYSNAGKYTCQYCGQKDSILNSIKLLENPPDIEMFAIEYYCQICGRGYKTADDEDKKLFEEAKEEFERKKDKLLFPRQKIPIGYNTKQMINHNYKYFHQMFNARQLLCFSVLLEEILKIEDENTREYMLLTFSNTVNANNVFCKYNMRTAKIEPLFGLHAYHPVQTPVENNVWGTKIGRGSFLRCFSITTKSKKYSKSCYEFDRTTDKPQRIAVGDSAMVKTTSSMHEFNNISNVALLKAQSSEDLTFMNTVKVDAIITDPPYCDNVMYSEISDFFYVWLRLGLADRYKKFEAEFAPRTRELVKNKAQGKDENYFFEGLTRVFEQCNQVLRDDGLLVFTFHHKETWAWKSVLGSILKSGFYVTTIYPIRSEGRTGIHGAAGNIRYDIPFVCHKRLEESRSITWEKLKDEIYFRAQETVNKVKKDSTRSISDADLFVIVMGRCLELYSKHYPNVIKSGNVVDVDKAVDDIQEIVDSLIKSFELKQLPANIDNASKLYLLYLAGKRVVSFDEINKRIQTGGGEMNLFFKRKYIDKKGRKIVVVSPQERYEILNKGISRSSPLIDAAHYLFTTYEKGVSMSPLFEKLGSIDLVAVLDLLYKKTGGRTYSKIAEQLRDYLISGKRELF